MFYLHLMRFFFLLQISDLDSEDGKKDSMVDVLFKRALKEFRQNIFSLYSSSLMVTISIIIVFIKCCKNISILLNKYV